MSVSSRILRKFQVDRLAEQQADDGSEVEDIPYRQSTTKKQLNINPYNLLNPNSQSESEVKEDDDENEPELNAEQNFKQARELSKRKKKKKRKKTNQPSQRKSSGDVDEVERSVREVNALLGDAAASVSTAPVVNISKKGILSVERKHLNPKNELKRIFGSKIIQVEQKRKSRGGRTQMKGTWLVIPQEHWLPLGKQALSMRLMDTEQGCQMFSFVHSEGYQSVQTQFLEAVESSNPDNIVAIANTHPYHIDSLIQLSDICKMAEDLARAAELIERALYSLESAFHPLFNLAKGNCRLDYRRQENRALFIALFKHLQFVGQRACYRTALEFCKLLFSLDPQTDPMAVVLVVDFYAIRAREFTWLLEFIEEWDTSRNLNQLPNMAFSKAMAQFHVSGSSDQSDALLQDALLMFPGVLVPLLDKCGVQPDPRTNSHEYFRPPTTQQSLSTLMELYVHRCYHLWKEPGMLTWLEKNTLAVLTRVDNGDLLVEEYAQKRSKRFVGKSARVVDRHILLSDIKEMRPVLDDASGFTFAFDPLPPLDSINLYVRCRNRTLELEGNPLSLFFRSLMPNFNVDRMLEQNGVEEGQAEGPAEQGAAARVYLHRGVNNLLEAMRDLLANIQPTPHTAGTDEEDADDTSDEGNDS